MSALKIETQEDLWRVMTIARGGNPDAIQAVSEFMNFKSTAERSFFPDHLTTMCTAQLRGFGKAFFPNKENNPFAEVAELIEIHYMAYKGEKSKQFVQMTQYTTNLSDLESAKEDTQQGILDRIKGRRNNND